MRHISLILCLLGCAYIGHSQKHDHHWVLGQETYEPMPIFGGTDLIFGEDSVTSEMVTRDIWFEFTNASICDRGGNLMFATNGIRIIGNDQQLIENGDSINAGDVHDDFVDYGYPCAQSAIILPSSTRDSLFFLFHMRATTSGMGICDRMQKTLVDMRLNGGKGRVVYKNEIIKEHNFAYGKITATKHGNGRDWWVVQPEKSTNGYFKVLFARDSVLEIQEQKIGPVITLSDSRGQSVFSPDGSKYARYDHDNDLNIFGFDRCSGELSDPVHVAITDASDTTFAYGGLAFSPNSRFLYVSAWDRVYQFDTEATDIAASKVVVASYDGFELPYPTTFYLMQLGPNGKIYLSSPNQVNMLHVINSPDEPGLACDFQQHGLITPTYIVFGLPHFPNYRLGALAGSPCDSLISEAHENVETQLQIKVFPNPASDALTIMLPNDFTEGDDIVLFNQFGQALLVSKSTAGNAQFELSLKNIPNGVYFLKVMNLKGQTLSSKVTINH
ncbi:MAG: T9SS type A sorting domain-containing protein [Saprospiraceae bacterium]|nr:T9SS type A sorting domain-containing protein [Saprospiraceae bacterium]